LKKTTRTPAAGKPQQREERPERQADEAGDRDGRQRDPERQGDDAHQHRVTGHDQIERRAERPHSSRSRKYGRHLAEAASDARTEILQ
jgi:hypothetical protein